MIGRPKRRAAVEYPDGESRAIIPVVCPENEFCNTHQRNIEKGGRGSTYSPYGVQFPSGPPNSGPEATERFSYMFARERKVKTIKSLLKQGVELPNPYSVIAFLNTCNWASGTKNITIDAYRDYLNIIRARYQTLCERLNTFSFAYGEGRCRKWRKEWQLWR